MYASFTEPRLVPEASPDLLPRADSPYWLFYEQVAVAQLAAWLPAAPCLVLELSCGPVDRRALLVAAGHVVLQVRAEVDPAEPPPVPGAHRLLADSHDLRWLQDASVDAIVVESQVLSRCLATEVMADHLARVLRPGGRVLLIVESLLLGLARLADQGRWAELADIPAADCVLVPGEDGTITRCFWPQELRGLLTGAGLEVDWVRPRSVLSVSAVERAIASEGAQTTMALVKAELALAQEHEGESTGLHLIASAVRPV